MQKRLLGVELGSNGQPGKQILLPLSDGGVSNIPDPPPTPAVCYTDGTGAMWGKIPRSLIQEDFAITSFACGTTQLELGASVVHPTFSASYVETPTTATIIDSSGHAADSLVTPFTSFVSTYTYSRNTQGVATFTLSATLRGVTKTASQSITWLPRKFYGHHVGGSPLVVIAALQSSLASGRTGPFTTTAGAGEYIYFAIPQSFGTPQFFVGGFEGGFDLVDTVSYANPFGVSLTYDLYRSDNPGLGLTTVVVQ